MLSRETFLLVFLSITIICSVFIYSIFGILYNNDFKCPKVNLNSTEIGKPTISIFTDKIKYMQGELVHVSGSVCDKNGQPGQEKILIQLSKLRADWFSQAYQSFVEKIFGNSTSKPYKPEIFYKTLIFSINGSYADSILNTQEAGSYNISATLVNLNETSFTKIEVEDPSTTATARISFLAIASFVLLLFLPGILLDWGGIQNGVHLIEKVNFLLISVFITSVIFALSLADVALGPNSPVGLVVKPSLDAGQVTEGGEWIINIGGHPNNNYTDGISIPVYVIVFGIVGGFIRYLYETATSYLEETKKELKNIEEEISRKKTDDFKYLEIKESTITWLAKFLHPKDTHTNPKENNKSNKKHDKNKINLDKIKITALRSEIRRYFLYQALKNLALIILSPLLAIAVWLLLVQVGFQGQEADVQGQTGIFILATISFTVGLVTDEVVQSLTRFTKERLGSGTVNKKPMKISRIKVAKNPVENGKEQTIEVIISNEDSGIGDAIVKGTVTNPSNQIIKEFRGLTDDSGLYSYFWKIENTPLDKYTVKLDISAKDYEKNSITTTFEVT